MIIIRIPGRDQKIWMEEHCILSFSHFIDLLYWMIGDIKNVKAYTRNFAHQRIIEFEDAGVVIAEFFNGAIGTINYTVNSFEKNMEGSLNNFWRKRDCENRWSIPK